MSRALLALGLLAAALGCATAGSDGPDPQVASDRGLELDTWLRVEAEDFVLVTNVSEAEATRAAHRLTRFADTVRVLMPGVPIESPMPVRVVGYRTLRQYREFGPRGTIGYMHPGLRGPTLAASLERRDQATPVLYHEFAHFLMENERNHEYPVWYHEGFAELLSTMVVREDLATIGFVPAFRLSNIRSERRVPVETLLTLRDRSDDAFDSTFYADAWLLVHYLHMGQTGVGTKLLGYLRALMSGTESVAAFEENFGLSADELETALEEHRQRVRGRFARVVEVTVPERERGFEPRPIAPAEVAALLGRHLIEIERVDSARELLRFGLEAAPHDPALRLELARADAAEGEFLAAEEAARAVLEASDEAAAWTTLGWVLVQRADSLRQEDAAEQARLDALTSARAAFEEGLARDDGDAWGWYGLARTYTEGEDDPAPGIAALERARAVLPWNLEIHLTLAALLAREGSLASALSHARIAVSLAHGEEQAERASEFLRQLEEALGEANAESP